MDAIYQHTEHLAALLRQPGISHKIFGDLLRADAVRIDGRRYNGSYTYKEFEPTSIHLTVTGRCYARCKGCINAAITTPCESSRAEKAPIDDAVPERDAAAIANLLREHPENEAVICFYGGEPLLVPEIIGEVMDRIEAVHPLHSLRYMLYTNGDLLQRTVDAFPELMRRFWLVSVSIDGRKAQHDSVRLGTSLDRIHRGMHALAENSPSAVLMWSTLREEQRLFDCFEEFTYLYERGHARQFFWHWVETDAPFVHFERYVAKYEEDLERIIEAYVESLQQGIILPLVHVNELVLFALTGRRRNSSACGVELSENYDIIGGKIHSCADLPPELAIGTIDGQGNLAFLPHNLMGLVSYKDSLGCYRCGVHAYCGGRCPVQAHAGSPERLTQYCQLMRLHTGTVLRYLGKIAEAMHQHRISAQDLYDASALYAQFTDVTP